MATVIIDVDISPANAAQKASELLSSMQKIKDQQTILIATGQKQTQEYANNTTALKKLTQEQKAYTIIAESAEGSNNQLRAQLTLLTNQYNALSREERENTEAGKALQAQTRAISDELKGNEKAVGDNRRNVGNYRDVLNEASAAGIPFAGGLSKMATQFGSLTGIIKTNIVAVNLWKLALASTGIGLIVVALGSLVTYLASTQAGMDKVTAVTRPLVAIFQSLIGAAQDLGKALMNPQEALQSIINFFKNPLDGIKKAAKDTKDFFINAAKAGSELDRLQKQIEDNEISLISEKEKLLRIEKEQGEIAKDASKSEAERQAAAQKALKAIDDATKLEAKDIQLKLKKLTLEQSLNDTSREGYMERAKLTAQLDTIEAEAAQKRIRLTSTVNKLNKEGLKDQKELADARKKASEEQAKANQALLESQNVVNNFLVDARQQEINNINLDINKKIEIYKKYGKTVEGLESERQARLLALSAQYAKEDQKQIETYLKEQENLLVSGIQNETDRKFAQAELQRKRNIESIDKEIAETEERIKKGDIRATAVLIEQLNTKDAIIKQNSIEREQQLKDQYDIELEMFNQHQVDLAEAQLISAGSESEQLMARQTLLEAMYQQDIDMAIKTGADTTLITAQYEDEKLRIFEDGIASSFASFKGFSSEFQKMVGENTLAYKIAGEVQAKVDAAQALRNNILIIQENVKALSSQGKLPFPYNLVAIASTLAALFSAANAAKTIFSMPKGFAEGGQFVSDGKGSVLPGYSKHDNINARLRSGEGVVVSEAMKDPTARNAISAINVAYGGRDFSVPNYTGGFATGGIAQGGYVTSLSDSVNQSNDISNAIVRGLLQAPPAIVDVRQIITESQKAFAVQVNQNI